MPGSPAGDWDPLSTNTLLALASAARSLDLKVAIETFRPTDMSVMVDMVDAEVATVASSAGTSIFMRLKPSSPNACLKEWDMAGAQASPVLIRVWSSSGLSRGTLETDRRCSFQYEDQRWVRNLR